MSKVVYFHFNQPNQRSLGRKMLRRFQSRTVAVEAVSGEDIMKLATAMLQSTDADADTSLYVRIKMGVTYVSPRDTYSKKTGREEASKRMKEVNAEVEQVEITKTHVFVRLAIVESIRLSLRVNKSTGFATVTGYMTLNG